MKSTTNSNNEASLPLTFQLQREKTLMPKEFRERMSARHKTHKSSAARSSSQTQKSRIKVPSQNSHTGSIAMDANSSQSHVNGFYKSPTDFDQTRFSYLYNNNERKEDKELISSSSHIALNEDFKFMMDNAYANYEGNGMYSIKTPPSNMHIGDLMTPLEEWGSNSIREKKYTVLPSIKSPQSDNNSSIHRRLSIGSSQNNQLDFTRDKIEKEADFFADFRVNTSRVKPTPRQEPLPPIRLGEITQTNSASSKRSNISSCLQHKTNEKQSIYS